MIWIIGWVAVVVLIFGAVAMCSRDMPKQEGAIAIDRLSKECPECDGNGYFCDESCIPNPGQCINCIDTSSKRVCLHCNGTGIDPDWHAVGNKKEFFKSLEEDDVPG